MEQIAKRLRKLRLERKLTQDDLAQALAIFWLVPVALGALAYSG